MRFYTETTNGPSPGITVIGTKDDLLQLGGAIQRALDATLVATDSDGSIRLENVEIHGDPWDWIVFRIDESVEQLIENRVKKEKRSCFFIPLFYILIVVTLYLAIKGLISIFI